MSGPWAISIRTPKKSIMKVIPKEEGESLKECLRRAKECAKALRQKYSHRDDIVIEIISRLKAFPKPTNIKMKKSELWCPYCAKPRRFKSGYLVEIDGISYISSDKRCVICGMSDNDFHVKTENHLWPSIQDIKIKR